MMTMRQVCGRIRRIYPKERLFEILLRGKIEFFYLTRSQMKKFSPYLQEGLFVHFKCKADKTKRGPVMAQEVLTFVKLIDISHRNRTVYFDIDTIKRGVQKVLNRPGYRMFLDMEFTMPPYDYNNKQGFVTEIIQYGILIEDENGQVIERLDSLVKPKYELGLNARTFNFLGLNRDDFERAVTYKVFYRRLKYIINKYHPIIYVWGKNDMIIINQSYELNKVTPLTERKDFVNLMQLLKNYFGLKTDIGLFNALSYFDEEIGFKQDHDAMADAEVTSIVFGTFKKMVNDTFASMKNIVE